jgi:hypothetical protein
MYILSFDLGIRNLAFCLMDVSGSSGSSNEFNIHTWTNYDLLAGTDSQTASRCSCGGPPSWTDLNGSIWCKKCVKQGKTTLKGLPASLVKLDVKSLKAFALAEGWTIAAKPPPKKEDYMRELQTRYLLPYAKPKNTIKTDLIIILTAMEAFLDKYLATFAKAVEIRIENQPVFDAPTMKSVQIILFTLLAHRLRVEHAWTGRLAFVHASKKTEEVAAEVEAAGGDYKARKDGAEALVLTKLATGPWRDFFLSKKKRSDLADAFLMCLRSNR